MRFGISPFGLPRPDRRPAGITGFSQYDKLYADAEKWLENGWLDYWAPQLYWPITRTGQQFPVLLDYWLAQNPLQRHVWPGLFTSRVGTASAATQGVPGNIWPAREIADQLAVMRARPAAGGHIHFSLIALQQDRDGLATLLQQGAYATPALVPATPWLSAPAVGLPGLRRVKGKLRIERRPGRRRARALGGVAPRMPGGCHQRHGRAALGVQRAGPRPNVSSTPPAPTWCGCRARTASASWGRVRSSNPELAMKRTPCR